MSIAVPQHRRQVIRLIAAGVVLLSFVALAAFAIAASRSSISIAAARRAAAPVASAPPATLPAVPSLVSFSQPVPAAAPLPAPVEAPVPEAAAEAAPLATPPVLADDKAPLPPCALGLPAPTSSGGLANLIGIVPLFGPFSAEAFAFMPAFQPGLDAVGPLLPVAEKVIAAGQPLIDAITPAIQQGSQAVFDALTPFYGPVRQNVLDAEASAAAQLAPVVQALATAPGSECLVALEGVLADAVTP